MSVEDRVAAGVALLDERDPGWAQRLPRLSRLAIGSAENCVLGQLYGYFYNGWTRLRISGPDTEAYGFAEWDRGKVGRCNAAWRRAILERRS